MSIQNGINYDDENCQCGHVGSQHKWRAPESNYRCTVSHCKCSLFTPLLTPQEIQARNELLRSDPRKFLEDEAAKCPATGKDQHIDGRHSREIQHAFEEAAPILDRLHTQYSDVSQSLIHTCLANRVRLALDWPDPVYRKTVAAWIELWRAWDNFCRAASGDQVVTLAQLKEISKSQPKQMKLRDAAALYRDYYKKEAPWLRAIQESYSLPSPETVRSSGRPSAFFFDVQARALREHFKQKTGDWQYKAIAEILSCGPRVHGISFTQKAIRDRLQQWQKKRDEWITMGMQAIAIIEQSAIEPE